MRPKTSNSAKRPEDQKALKNSKRLTFLQNHQTDNLFYVYRVAFLKIMSTIAAFFETLRYDNEKNIQIHFQSKSL